MRVRQRWVVLRRLVATGLAFGLAGCADLAPVRDFGRSAAAVSAYPEAATAYVESARISAAFVVASPESFVGRSERQAQADDALALHRAVGGYFATLAALAGDDTPTLAMLKAMAGDTGHVFHGRIDRTTIDAYADLARTLARYAETPARERAVRGLVEQAGPSAMRIVASLRQVAADWRAEVANDAKQVDDTLAVAVLPADVPPLLRALATDRRAELSRSFAATLRRMKAAETSLAAVETAHAAMVARLDDLSGAAAGAELRRATAAMRAAAGVVPPLGRSGDPGATADQGAP